MPKINLNKKQAYPSALTNFLLEDERLLHGTWGAARAFAGMGLIGSVMLGCGSAARAQTDITYGGDARYFSMGGAGVALLQERSGSRINPASIAYESQPYALLYPTIGLRSNGASLGNVTNYLINGQKRGDAGDIARSFAKNDSDFGVNGNVGLRVGKIEISGSAVGRGRIQPNADLSNWAKTSNDPNLIPATAQSDIFAAGYYVLPAIAFASTLPAKSDSVRSYGVGARLKYMRGVYSHYIADSNVIINGGDALRAQELGSKSNITKNGLGIDLGFLARPRRPQEHFSYAAVIANAVKPKFDFDGTDRDGNNKKYKLLATTITTGLAYQKAQTTFALDLSDLTSSAGKTQLRAGVEQRVISNFYLRGGYNSTNGFVYGVGAFGFDIAVGRRQPLELVKTINF